MIKLGKLQINPIEYAINGNAILGIKDSGKSYTATLIAERLFDAGIPFTTFDPTGVWAYLKTPGAGKGYPVVVASAKGGDLPLTVASAPEYVRGAAINGISLVLDLSGVDFSKADWRRIVKSCINVLLHENKQYGLRHVFLEEAAEFIPQKPLDGEVYAAVEKLARIGGNSRLGYTLINQRSQEIAKSALELCENVFLHRQRGKNALENLDKWLDVAGAEERKAIIKAMPNLPAGECYAWIGGANPQPPMLIKVPRKNSLHPNRRLMRGEIDGTLKPAADVSAFVIKMRSTSAEIEQQAKDNDPAALRKQIADLKYELANGQPDSRALEAASGEGFNRGRDHMRSIFAETAAPLSEAIHDLANAVQRLQNIDHMISQIADAPINTIAPNVAEQAAAFEFPQKRATRIDRTDPEGGIPSRIDAKIPFTLREVLPKGERACLIAIAQHRRGVTRQHLSVITGYKRSTRDAYIQRLRERGHVEDGERTMATAAGIKALGADYQPLPTGKRLQDHTLTTLPEGERRILQSLISAYPASVHLERLDAETGFKRSTRDAYLQRLDARELIERGSGIVKASGHLF